MIYFLDTFFFSFTRNVTEDHYIIILSVFRIHRIISYSFFRLWVEFKRGEWEKERDRTVETDTDKKDSGIQRTGERECVLSRRLMHPARPRCLELLRR